MVYLELQTEGDSPIYEVDWAGEIDRLRQSALRTIGVALGILGYVWGLGLVIDMQPGFSWAPLALPSSICLLGILAVLIRQPQALRDLVFVAGSLGIGAMALFVQRSTYSPFICVVVITAVSIVADARAAFLVAALSSTMLSLASVAWPGQWPSGFLVAIVALYWAVALASWLASRDLRTVLSWALQSYESNLRIMRRLQVERGKLNATLRALADANLLLKRTTHDLAEAREEAERARQLKSQFAANISHELRTPLHLIVGFSQMMYASPENYKGVRWTPDLRADLKEVYDSAQHLLRLIDDVLDLSQVEAARLPVSKERLSLLPLVREAVGTARNLFRGQNLYLRVDIPEEMPPLYADPTRIRQVLFNLLNNAARFTEQGGITVSARLLAGEVEVVVEDTGIGIPADELREIFTEFHQVDGSLRRRYHGTGLGLSICKQFVSLHGGRIWAESEVGRGSAFHFTLPLPSKQVVRTQQSQYPRGWRYPAPNLVAHRLVTLAQPPELPRLLRRHLSQVDVIEAKDAHAAAGLARTAQADAVVLLEEHEAEAIEIAQATADLLLPVITCSLPLERHSALAEGFTHCLMKPFTTEQLVQTVRQVAPQAKRALVVDDDPGVVRLIERALAARLPDLAVLTAYDGLEAISMLEQEPDILLLDLLLPKASGLDVLRALRERQQVQPSQRLRQANTIPVVAITAYGFEQDMAALGHGTVSVRRGLHYSATDLTRWLQAMLQVLPARHLSVGEATVPELAPAPSG